MRIEERYVVSMFSFQRVGARGHYKPIFVNIVKIHKILATILASDLYSILVLERVTACNPKKLDYHREICNNHLWSVDHPCYLPNPCQNMLVQNAFWN